MLTVLTGPDRLDAERALAEHLISNFGCVPSQGAVAQDGYADAQDGTGYSKIYSSCAVSLLYTGIADTAVSND